MSKKEATLILIKPDGLARSLTGNILTRLSETKLEIVASKMVKVSRKLATEHYKHLKDEAFFEELIKYILGEFHSRKKVMALVYAGEGAVGKVRSLAGATNPEQADSTSIRGSFGRITSRGIFENVIHCSANAEEAEAEIKLWFNPEEIIIDLFKAKEIIERETTKKEWV